MCYQLNDVHAATVLRRAVHSFSCSHCDRCLLPLVGYLRIPMEDIQGRSMVEKWYPLSTAVVGRGGSTRSSEHVQLRVRGRYHTVDILPTDMYQSFVQVTSPIVLIFHGHSSYISDAFLTLPVAAVSYYVFPTCSLQYLEEHYCSLLDALEPSISVKAKQDIATCLVSILHKRGKARDFLADIVMSEICKTGARHVNVR